MAVLRGERVVLRPVTDGDAEALAAILAEESVARWWSPGTALENAEAWLEDDEDTTVWVIEADGATAGSISAWEQSDPDYRHAGIDLFLSTAHQGRGLGTDAIRTVARHLFADRGHHRITIDPSAANARAIAAYRRVGFREVGVLRRYERGRDGTFHDGLLMDLLDGELR
ncbi:MAG: GNAT family protein [Thermoleophilia bacterium]